MRADSLLPILRSLMAQPTAPFCEDAVRVEVLLQLAQMPSVSTKIDSFGNVIATFKRGSARPQWVLNAHMDHPGFVGDEFLGGVPKEYLDQGFPRREYGHFAMWDLPAFEFAEGKIYSRACDNLVGCAAIIATFQELERGKEDVAVIGVFTCAEEVGLLGAVYVARSGVLDRGLAILSLETSSERPPAQMHEGVIVRTGDRTSTFDSDLTAELMDLAKLDGIRVQRCLMSGGTCEATAYRLYGYRVAGACVALGNYHNCGPDGQIQCEYVSLADVEALVSLCIAVAKRCQGVDHAGLLRAELERRLETEIRKRFSNL